MTETTNFIHEISAEIKPFKPREEQREQLLKPGQSVDDWWAENGLDHEATRARRKLEYARQRQEASVKFPDKPNPL